MTSHYSLCEEKKSQRAEICKNLGKKSCKICRKPMYRVSFYNICAIFIFCVFHTRGVIRQENLNTKDRGMEQVVQLPINFRLRYLKTNLFFSTAE